MRFLWFQRDIIADSIETVVSAQWYDAVLAVVGCDKKYARFYHRYGKIKPSCYHGVWRNHPFRKWKGESLNIVSAFEALNLLAMWIFG